MITWANLRAIIRPQIGESTSGLSDADLLHCCNAAILSVYGELFTSVTPAAITITTGTTKYNVPNNFVYIDEIRDSNDVRIPDRAWELGAGPTPVIIFEEPYFTPTTGQNPTVYGRQTQPVLANDASTIEIDPGFVLHRTLANVHSALGAGTDSLAAWHQAEHARHSDIAEKRLEDEWVLAEYRPKPEARMVPGRASIASSISRAGYVVAAYNAADHEKQMAHYVCSGTDDHVEIQLAINALPTQGGLVQLTSGDFNLGAAVTGHNGLTLLGRGTGATRLNMAGTLAASIMLNFDSHTDIRIAHLSLDKNRPDATDQGDAIRVTDCARVVIEDVYSRESTKHGIFVGGASGCSDVVIRSCTTYDSNSTGIRVQRGSKVLIEGNHVNTCDGNGIYVTTCNDVRVANNWVYNTTDEGIELGKEAGEAACIRFTVVGNAVDTYVNDGIYANDCSHGTITGNTIHGGGTGSHGINVNAASAGRRNITITGNTIYDVDTTGIRVNQAEGIVVEGNEIYLTTGKTCTDGIRLAGEYANCSGNTLYSEDEDGFTNGIQVTQEYCTIAGNTIFQAYTGIYLNAAALCNVSVNRVEIAQWCIYVGASSFGNLIEINHLILDEREGGEAVTDLACIRVGGSNVANNAFLGNYLRCGGSSRGIYIKEEAGADRNKYYRNWLNNAEGTLDQVITLVGSDSFHEDNVHIQGGPAPRPMGHPIADPGDAGAIPVTASGEVALVTGGAETRTLAIPTFIGQQIDLFFKTDGGNCAITAASAINMAGNTIMTFDNAGEHIRLVGIDIGGTRYWRVVCNDGVGLS